jgi:hypothetical protein
MGVLSCVVPLDDSIVGWLRDRKVDVPELIEGNRNPTPREVRHVCAEMKDVRTKIYAPPHHAYQVMFEGLTNPNVEPWTLLNISKYNGNEDYPHEIWFEKGWPSLILRVVLSLSKHCGSLVIIPDTGCDPIVVNRDGDVRNLLQRWDHTRGVDGC